MAQNIELVPGPLSNEVLYAQDKHISSLVWTQPNKLHLQKIHNTNKFGENITHPGLLACLHRAGFYGLYHLMFVRIDWALITALIERWRPETHTFHFPVGEVSITLQDIEVLAGVRVDGPPLIRDETDDSKTARFNWIRQLFGREPDDETFTKHGLISLSWLSQHFDPDTLALDAHVYRVECVARACILRILASQYMQDMQGSGIQTHFLPFLRDLEECGTYSWGSAILAFLYRSLCKASSGKVDGVNGALALLQFWAWSRFRQVGPNDHLPAEEVPPFQNWPRFPYGRRWALLAIRYDRGGIGHSLLVYRDQFDQMQSDQVIWEPYRTELNALPESCKGGESIWRARVPLICMDIVEWHYPERVLRQFGMRQGVPEDARKDVALHALSRKGRSRYNWANRHGEFVMAWGERHQRVTFDVSTDEPTTTDDYMAWYQRITRRWISPTYTRPPSRGIQPTAARLEIMYQALCSNYRSFQLAGNNIDMEFTRQAITNAGFHLPPMDPTQATVEPEEPTQRYTDDPPQPEVATQPSQDLSREGCYIPVPYEQDVGPSYGTQYNAMGSIFDTGCYPESYANPSPTFPSGGLPMASHTRAPVDRSGQRRRRVRGQPDEEESNRDGNGGSSSRGPQGCRPVSGFFGNS